MGMYDNMKDIIKVLRNDEILLRLLCYPVKNYSENIPDPLDESLPNILDKDKSELKEIREKRFLLVPKASDLVNNPICRLYIYAGNRNPDASYHLANQEIVIDVLCHIDFEEDLRSMKIGDRLNELLVREKITGIGKMNYVTGRQLPTVVDYVQYQHVYKFGVARK
jgi:hypothetical protein